MTLQARPRSLSIAVDDALHGVLALGLIEADHLQGDPLPAAFIDERDRIVRRWVSQYGGRQPADVPGVAETRALFHELGIDPTKHRPSSDSLRTSITPDTRNAIVVLFCPAHRAAQSLSGALEHVAGMLSRHCGATVTTVRLAQ